MQRTGTHASESASSPASVTIQVSIQDFICPITDEIFFEPEMLIPCGH